MVYAHVKECDSKLVEFFSIYLQQETVIIIKKVLLNNTIIFVCSVVLALYISGAFPSGIEAQ